MQGSYGPTISVKRFFNLKRTIVEDKLQFGILTSMNTYMEKPNIRGENNNKH